MDFVISETLGIEAKFDVDACLLISFNRCVGEEWHKGFEDGVRKGIWRSLRLARNQGVASDLEKFWGTGRTAYSGNRRFYQNLEVLAKLDKMGIRPDITFLPFGVFDLENVRTQGHRHRLALPEIYSVVLGTAGFLLFEFDESLKRVKSAKLVIAHVGEHAVFGPGEAHITVNLHPKLPLVVTDLVSTRVDPEFDSIERLNGGPYWVLYNSGGFPSIERNPAYLHVPKLEVVRPAPEVRITDYFVLKKGNPLFRVPESEQGLNAIKFLNDINQERYHRIYKNAFIPFKV